MTPSAKLLLPLPPLLVAELPLAVKIISLLDWVWWWFSQLLGVDGIWGAGLSPFGPAVGYDVL